ncbi:MAG: methyltransferase [Propionicimonas sp.]|nr:methyltransferase [Propionicimonas sp.]
MDHFGVIDLMTGYQPAAVVASGVRLGVFDALRSDPATPAELAARLGLAGAPVAALLPALERLGLAGPGPDGRFGLTEAGGWLTGDDGLALVSLKEAFFATVWSGLDTTLRTGAPVLRGWRERLASDPDQCLLFLRALRVLARLTGPDLTGLPALGAGRRVLDVGGGLGSYAVPLAAAGADVTIAELSPVAAWARHELADPAGLLGTVTVIEDDVLMEGRVGEDFDAVLVSHVLHDLADSDAVRLLAGARSRVAPGTDLVVFELAGDAPGTIGPFFDLMMQVEGPGRARRAPEVIDLVASAGWGRVAELPAARPHLLVGAVA